MTVTQQKAVAYYRVSSEQQRERQSIELQKLKLQSYAKEKEYKIVKSFVDDGVSGEEISKRPGFESCLSFIEKGKADLLLVYMVDRIGRFKARKDRNRVIELLESSETSVDSPYDGYFNYAKEEDLNSLEGLMNESRRDNRKRGIRVHEGHTAKRLAGCFSGGRLPYGLGFQKGVGFYITESEKATLEDIFNKVIDGWGIIPLRDHLNANLERFPKRIRKYKGHEVKRWTDQNIWQILHNDFYFTGVIEPTEQSKAKGVPAVDTGIKLFPKDLVERARREMATRRFRAVNDRMPNRKRIHAQTGKVYFTDALLHGIVRCAHCGTKMGLNHLRRPSGRVHSYYVCRNKQARRNGCSCPNISVRKLDRAVWAKFIETMEDPEKMQEMILQGAFFVDKDRKEQFERLNQYQEELGKLQSTLERTTELYRWGDYSKKKYLEKRKGIGGLIERKGKQINQLSTAIRQPQEIKGAVEAATEYVSNQIEVFRALTEIRKLAQYIKSIGEGADLNVYGRLKAKTEQVDLLEELFEIVENYDSDVSEYLKRFDLDVSDFEIYHICKEMIFKQKRQMLQNFLDVKDKKGVLFRSIDDFDVYFSLKASYSLLRSLPQSLRY